MIKVKVRLLVLCCLPGLLHAAEKQERPDVPQEKSISSTNTTGEQPSKKPGRLSVSKRDKKVPSYETLMDYPKRRSFPFETK